MRQLVSRDVPPLWRSSRVIRFSRGAPHVSYWADLIVLRKSSSSGATEDAIVNPGMSIQPALVSMIPGVIWGQG